MNNLCDFDEGFYSRQIYVLGQNYMRKLGECDVLISGLGGLGAEIAKNLTLAGVRSITLHDQKLVEASDLSSQFFVSENDLGKNRAEMSREKLSELNHYVEVKSCDGPLNESLLSRHGVVVLTDSTIGENLKVGEFCHQSSIYFLSANVAGVFGQIFCDFGNDFTIQDKINRSPSVASIHHISRGKDEIFIRLQQGSKHSFAVNDFIKFEGVEMMERINEIPHACIKAFQDKESFSIERVDGLDIDYGFGGFVKEIRMPETVHFSSYAEGLSSPKYASNDVINEDLLHLAFQVLDEFRGDNGHFPRPHSMLDAENFVARCLKRVDEKNSDVKIDESLLKKFAMVSCGKICPLHSVIGSISAQEIIKAITKKCEPMNQWFYFSACEVLPPNFDDLNEEDCAPQGSRYDAQMAIFGSKHQEKILNSKLFMVGVGAIGCEMLKNWAMLGIGSGYDGQVTITDMDMIEKSNLNRQFLFRPEHIGKMKSTTAAEMTRKMMNPRTKVEAHENRVSKDSEDVYNDTFFESFDVIVNALDNIPARQYVASKCVYHNKPLLESGTEGTICNVQVILPGLSCSYQGSDDSNGNIPLCTLKYFPTSVEHTIQWARDDFEGSFKLAIKTASDFLKDENFVENMKQQQNIESLGMLKEVAEIFKGFFANGSPILSSDEICIRLARLKFEKHFNNEIQQLRHNFPEDAKTNEGLPFWFGTKKCPKPISFDRSDSLHMDYIISCANMFASVLQMPAIRTEDAKIIADLVEVPCFRPNSEVVIPSNDAEAEEYNAKSFDDKEFEMLLDKLPKRNSLKEINLELQGIEFEKDCDLHVDFITASSNLRASNYGITPIDKLETKRIVGKIIPAIATTTSLVVGLACLELLKILMGQKDLKKFKNWYCQLGSNVIFRYNVKPAMLYKYNGKEFTIWDYILFEKDVTLGDIKDKLKKEKKVDVKGIFHGYSSLVSEMTPQDQMTKRNNMRVSEAMEKMAKVDTSNLQSVQLTIIGALDEEGKPVDELPFLKVKLS